MRWRLGLGCLLLAAFFAGCGGPAPRTGSGTDPTGSTGPARSYPVGSLPAFLAADGRFSTFLGLLERDAVVLQEMLAEPDRPFTLFVPTNDAFVLLGPEILAAFDVDEDLVTGIVERHFLAERLQSEAFVTTYLFTGMSRRLSRISSSTATASHSVTPESSRPTSASRPGSSMSSAASISAQRRIGSRSPETRPPPPATGP